MFRKALTSGGLLLLASVLFVLTPEFASAAGRGGHVGAGGFHAGHVGVAHVGGYHGGAYHGGFYRGGYYGRGYYGHGYANYGYRPYGRYGYRGYYGGYGRYLYPYVGGYSYYPYVGDYGYYSPSYLGTYDAYPNAAAPVPYSSGYDSYSDVMPPESYVSSSPIAPGTFSVPPATDVISSNNRARLTVTVPEAAQVWVNFAPTTATGPVREFQSPPLTPGVRYSYTVHARWYENGHEVDQTQRVEFTARDHINVLFPVVAASTAQTPAGTNG
jgi:uncharacterized protein (TIGR03000 family)